MFGVGANVFRPSQCRTDYLPVIEKPTGVLLTEVDMDQ